MTLQLVSGSTGTYTSIHLDEKKPNLLKASEHFMAKIMLEAYNIEHPLHKIVWDQILIKENRGCNFQAQL